MKDINFFKPYKSKNKSGDTKYYYQIAVLILGLIIVGTFSINVSKLIILNKEIETYQAKLNTNEMKEKTKVVETAKRQLGALTRYKTDLDSVVGAVEDRSIVTNSLLDLISETIPANVDFKSMNIKYDTIDIQAVTINRMYIAELQHNLKAIPQIEDVYIDSISGSDSLEGQYSFNVKCYLKGGAQ